MHFGFIAQGQTVDTPMLTPVQSSLRAHTSLQNQMGEQVVQPNKPLRKRRKHTLLHQSYKDGKRTSPVIALLLTLP